MIVGLSLWALSAGLALLAMLTTAILALCAAKDAHDAEHGLGRHHDELAAEVAAGKQTAPAPAEPWSPTPTRLAALLPTAVSAPA